MRTVIYRVGQIGMLSMWGMAMYLSWTERMTTFELLVVTFLFIIANRSYKETL